LWDWFVSLCGDSFIRCILIEGECKEPLNVELMYSWNRESYVNSPVPEVACVQKWGLWLLLRWGGSNCTPHCAAWSVVICTVHHQCFCTGCFVGTFKRAAICHRHERYMKFIFLVCSLSFVPYFFIDFVPLFVFISHVY